jgi:hypothetical protein
LSVAFRLQSITRNTFPWWSRADGGQFSNGAFVVARIEHHLMVAAIASNSKAAAQSITRNTHAPWALLREYPGGLDRPPDLLRAAPENTRQKGRFIRPFSVLGIRKTTSPQRSIAMRPK